MLQTTLLDLFWAKKWRGLRWIPGRPWEMDIYIYIILEKLPVDFAAMHTVLHVYDSHSAIKEWFKGDISWGQNLPKTLFLFLQEMHIFSLGSPWSCLRFFLTFCGKSSLNHHLRRHVYFLTIFSASISGNFSEHWNPQKRQARLTCWMSGSTRCLASNIFCRCQKSLELKRFNIRWAVTKAPGIFAICRGLYYTDLPSFTGIIKSHDTDPYWATKKSHLTFHYTYWFCNRDLYNVLL